MFGFGEPVTHDVMKDLFATGLMHNPEHATDELVEERTQIMDIMNGHVMATMQVPVSLIASGKSSVPYSVSGAWTKR